MEEYNLSPNVDRDYIEVNLDLHDKTSTSDVQNYYVLKQGDHISRVLRCNLTKGGLIPIDLKNSVLTLYIKKADMGLVAIKGTIVDATNGVVDFPLTRQSLAIADKIICEVVKIGSDASTMSFPLFTLQVEDSIADDDMIESTDEFSLLNDALASVSDCENRLNTQYNEFDEKFANKYGEIETQFNDKYTDVSNQFDNKYTEISNQFETKYNGLEEEYVEELMSVKEGLEETNTQLSQKESKKTFKLYIDDYANCVVDNDWTLAFSRAIEDLKSHGGGEIYLSTNEYSVDNIRLPHHTALIGVGDGSVIKHNVDVNSPVIELETDTTKFVQIKNLTVNGNRYSTNTEVDTISLITKDEGVFEYGTTDSHFLISNVVIKNSSRHGLYIKGRGESVFTNIKITYSKKCGLYAKCYDTWFENISIGNAGEDGFVFDSNSSNKVINCKAWMSGQANKPGTGYGYKCINCDRINVINCESQSNAYNGFYVNRCINCNFDALQSYDNGTSDNVSCGLLVENSSYNNFSGIFSNSNETKKQDYGLELIGNDFHNSFVVNTKNNNLGSYRDTDNNALKNSFYARGETPHVFENFEAILIGDGNPSPTVSPLYVKATDTNSYGSYIRKTSSNSGNKTLIRLEGTNSQTKVTTFTELLINPDAKLTTFYSDGDILFNTNLKISDSRWNQKHLIMGNYHFWVDSQQRLRMKNGAPTSETDGTIVGSQS